MEVYIFLHHTTVCKTGKTLIIVLYNHMFFYQKNAMRAFFSDRTYLFTTQEHYTLAAQALSQNLSRIWPAVASLDGVYSAKQVHGTHGLSIDAPVSLHAPSFFYEADYLITDQKNKGLMVVTADCMPVILYHEQKQVLAVAHIGWRGAVAGIIEVILKKAASCYGTNTQGWMFIAGPTARACCYEVQNDFIRALPHYSFNNAALFERNNKTYFDTVLYVQHQTYALGCNTYQWQIEQAVCTLCSGKFHSYRRDNKTNFRNITLAALK